MSRNIEMPIFCECCIAVYNGRCWNSKFNTHACRPIKHAFADLAKEYIFPLQDTRVSPWSEPETELGWKLLYRFAPNNPSAIVELSADLCNYPLEKFRPLSRSTLRLSVIGAQRQHMMVNVKSLWGFLFLDWMCRSLPSGTWNISHALIPQPQCQGRKHKLIRQSAE